MNKAKELSWDRITEKLSGDPYRYNINAGDIHVCRMKNDTKFKTVRALFKEYLDVSFLPNDTVRDMYLDLLTESFITEDFFGLSQVELSMHLTLEVLASSKPL